MLVSASVCSKQVEVYAIFLSNVRILELTFFLKVPSSLSLQNWYCCRYAYFCLFAQKSYSLSYVLKYLRPKLRSLWGSLFSQITRLSFSPKETTATGMSVFACMLKWGQRIQMSWDLSGRTHLMSDLQSSFLLSKYLAVFLFKTEMVTTMSVSACVCAKFQLLTLPKIIQFRIPTPRLKGLKTLWEGMYVFLRSLCLLSNDLALLLFQTTAEFAYVCSASVCSKIHTISTYFQRTFCPELPNIKIPIS